MPTKANASTTAKKADAAKTAPAKKANPALMKPLQPSQELAAVVGSDPLPRPEGVSKVWDYIKKKPSEPDQQARDQGRREAGEGVRQEVGHDVRDEQTPRPAPDLAGLSGRARALRVALVSAISKLGRGS